MANKIKTWLPFKYLKNKLGPCDVGDSYVAWAVCGATGCRTRIYP